MSEANHKMPVGADRRCAWCGACIAKGFGLWGCYEGRVIGFHDWCFRTATEVCEPSALELTELEERDDE